jgi:tRNA uracil 4-sulfurtransferase
MLFLLKIGEISLKGGNRGYFEKKLTQNIKRRLKNEHPKITGTRGRFLLEIGEEAMSKAERVLSTTFGLVGFSKALVCDKTMEDIRREAFRQVEEFLKDRVNGTFKITGRRSDKSFPLTSYEIAKDLGDEIRARYPGMKVDVHTPELLLSVEIRDKAYIYGNSTRGPGGLPVGVAGKGMLLLSGGIDSPVSAYLMAKRGLAIDAVYFHTYPYTSDEALEKVKTLANKLSDSCSGINLLVVPFTDVALKLRQSAPLEETTLLMRASMMDVASRLAAGCNALCLVTGESLSQVASQTAQSMHFTESTSNLPVFRPLIGLDKEEIISIAKRIDTYETSILPFEDCCTIFSPDKPLIRPDYQRMQKSYERLDISSLLEESIEKLEKFWYPPQ